MPSVRPAVMATGGRLMNPISDADVIGMAHLPMQEVSQTIYNEFDEYLQSLIDEPTLNPDLPKLLAKMLISIQAENGIVLGTDEKLFIDLKAINDRIDAVSSIINIVGMDTALPDPAEHQAGDAFIKTDDADHDGRDWLYVWIEGAWQAEGPFELNLERFTTDDELAAALAALRLELEEALAPANITLADEAASDMLPVAGSTNTQAALQTTRNMLKWLKDQVASALTDANLDDIRTSIATNAENIERKQDIITGAVTSYLSIDATPSRVVVSSAEGKLASSPVTSVELGYLSGVTSGIQTQLDAEGAAIDELRDTIVEAVANSILEVLKDTLTLHVRPDGSDSNDGSANTPEKALLTVGGALKKLTSSFIVAGQDVYISLAPGTYTEDVIVDGRHTAGLSRLYVVSADPNNRAVLACTDAVSRAALSVLNGASVEWRNIDFVGGIVIHSAYAVLRACNYHFPVIRDNVRHVLVEGGLSFANIISPSKVSGDSNSFVLVAYGAVLNIDNSFVGSTIEMVGNPSFSTACLHVRGNSIVTPMYGSDFVGSATGRRYLVDGNSMAYSGGRGPNWLPGTSAGYVDGTSVYL